MSEELIVKHCSPTLAGLKTGNLFACTYSDIHKLRDVIRRWNRQLGKKGLRFLPMRIQNNRALIYVYRPAHLSRDLQNETAWRLLHERGYGMETPERCVAQLTKRLCECQEFPHEIGLFLGYPPEDVCGFIENKADGYKCVGCWKVYGDEEKAQKTFRKYKKCTDIYCMRYAEGKTIERLTIAG